MFNSGLEAILMCRIRALKGGEYSLNDSEAQALDVLLAFHEQQVQIDGKAEVAAAIVKGFNQLLA